MVESFVKTVKRDYVSGMHEPDVKTALQNLAIAFDITTNPIRAAR